MFIEKLTESDLNNYAEGWFKQNLSEFECDSVEMACDIDYVGKLNEIKLKFSYYANVNHCDDEESIEAEKKIKDFSTEQYHIEFFTKKFGLDYVLRLREALKSDCKTAKYAKSSFDRAFAVYYEDLFKDKKQTNLESFDDKITSSKTTNTEKNLVTTTLDRFM